MEIDHYHHICSGHLSVFFEISTHLPVKPGAIYHFPSAHQLENVAEVAWIPNYEFHDTGWTRRTSSLTMDNGWTR
jgi:hypothetical protein